QPDAHAAEEERREQREADGAQVSARSAAASQRRRIPAEKSAATGRAYRARTSRPGSHSSSRATPRRYRRTMATETSAALAAQLAEDAAGRFLRYVRIDTQSDEDSDTYPSTAKQ